MGQAEVPLFGFIGVAPLYNNIIDQMNEEKNINQLPKDWKWVTLGDIAYKKSVKAIPIDYPTAKFIGMDCIEPHTLKPFQLYDFKDFKSAGNYFTKNQVLYGRMRPYLNKVYKAEFNGVCSGEFIILDCGEFFNPDLLKYILHSRGFVNFANSITTGDRPRISYEEISEYNILLPPKAQQDNVVSKIEELLSELDKGIENLRTAQQQLKTYRQSILKWAFEGKLTNVDLKEDELPKGWKMLKLKEVAKDISDGDHQAPPKSNSGIPFITISNVNKDNNKIDFSDTFSVDEEYYAKLKINRKPLKGDVLYTVTGSFGIPILIDFDKEFCFQRHIGLVRPLETTNQKWLYYLLQSPDIFNQAKATATGTAQKTVALNSLRNFEVQYSPIHEQSKIVQEIESRLSVADKMDESITQSLQQAEALRQSILKKAFEGRLV